MSKLMMQGLLTAAIALCMSSAALAKDDKDCSLKTLRGRYVFTASGFIVPPGAPPQPKAIIEVIDFDGQGGVAVPFVSLNVNGTPLHPPGAGGTYTLDESCNGTLTFISATAFDIVTSASGKEIWLIQTNPNNVFQGSAKRTSGGDDDDNDK